MTRALIATIHVAKKQLGLDEDSYRDALERATGRRSAAELDQRGLMAAVAHFERLGFRRTTGPKTSRPLHVRKIYALWGALQDLGAVARGPAGAPALRAFVKRQTGVAAPEFVSAEDAAKVIEALKAWEARVKRERAQGQGKDQGKDQGAR
jgi:hypothetical protein